MKFDKDTRSVALGYFGAVVGAGFISGQELAQFFLRFGIFGVAAWIVVTICIIFGASFALQTLASKKFRSFDQFVNSIFGKKVAVLANIVSIGYLLGGLIIMISGAGSLIGELFNIPLFIGVSIVTLAIFLTIVGKSKRMLDVNRFLVPILIALAVFSTVIVLSKNGININQQLINGMKIRNPSNLIASWWLAIPLYIGYNTIGAIVGFINITRDSSPESGKKGGLLGGLLIASLGSMLLLTLWNTYSSWNNAEMPIIAVVKQFVPWVYPLLAPAILIAMFTVATNYALGMSDYLKENIFTKLNFKTICALLLLIVAPIATLGFSSLLGTIYPFFGILATLLVLWLAIQLLFNLVRKSSRKQVASLN